MNNELTFLLGVLIAVIIVIAIRKTRKNNDHYDERQLMVRGRAYQIGFMTMLVFSASYMLLSVAFEELLKFGYLWNAMSMFVGLTIFAVYSILNDAFFSLKEKGDNYIFTCILVVVVNCIGISPSVQNITSIMDLIGSYKFLNVLCILSFVIILITLVTKRNLDRKDEE